MVRLRSRQIRDSAGCLSDEWLRRRAIAEGRGRWEAIRARSSFGKARSDGVGLGEVAVLSWLREEGRIGDMISWLGRLQ